VARRLPESDAFVGVAGQCRRSLGVAREQGAATVVDALNPHIEHFAGFDELECRRFGIRPSVHPRLRRRFELEYAAADVIRVESDFSRRTFLDRGFDPDRVAAIPPPIDVARFPASDLGGEVFRVCFVGLFQPWKGFHYLVEAFRRLALPDSELLMWGGAGSRAVARYLSRQAGGNPTIRLASGDLGQVGYEHAYGGASVLVHPSLADGWAYVVSEAMASGVPVIVSEWTGAAEMIVDGENGYVVPPRDVDAISDRLAHLAARPDLLREMGAAARRTAGTLSMEAFRGRLTGLLDHILRGRSTPADHAQAGVASWAGESATSRPSTEAH
jgi:glycosyltransferase involved in cell wall biosynthesis